MRVFCLNVQILLIKSNIKNFFANAFKFTFTTKATKISFNISKSKIIIFNVDFVKNIDIEFDFRDWNYARAKISLSLYKKLDYVCLNIDFNIILVDKTFFKTQTSNVLIRTMIFLISIRDLNTTKYLSINYVIVLIYFNNEKNNKSMKTKIVKEIHLINELKINILIDNDFIESKKIKINVINNFVYIDNCEIIIFLNVKTFRKIVHISIHARKTIIVSCYEFNHALNNLNVK